MIKQRFLLFSMGFLLFSIINQYYMLFNRWVTSIECDKATLLTVLHGFVCIQYDKPVLHVVHLLRNKYWMWWSNASILFFTGLSLFSMINPYYMLLNRWVTRTECDQATLLTLLYGVFIIQYNKPVLDAVQSLSNKYWMWQSNASYCSSRVCLYSVW